MSNAMLARRFYHEHFIKSDLKHKLVDQKDYITEPRESGYRGLHLIYRFHSKIPGKRIYNGLLVETQIRSRLQHLWATAVETVDFFTKQAIKSNEANQEWLDFFKLVSSAFAMMENSPLVPDTPGDEKELFLKIKEKEKHLNIIKKMKGWKEAVQIFELAIKNKKALQVFRYFLLELDIPNEKLNISTYTKSQEELAIARYSEIERRNTGKKDFDVVLVIETSLI